MPPISRSRFARYLRRLSADEFTTFVADLWAARGWSTEIRDGVVVATRGEPAADRQTLFVRHAASLFGGDDWRHGREDLTHVVTSGPGSERARETAHTADADLLDRDALYDMAVYALAPDVREELFQRHFGRSATVPERSGPVTAAVSRVRSRRVALVVIAIVIVFAAASASGTSLLGDSSINDVDRSDVPTIDTLTPESFSIPESGPSVAPATDMPSVSFFTPTPTPGYPIVTDPPTEVPGADEDAWRLFRGDSARTGHRPDSDGPLGEIGVLAAFTTEGAVASSPAVVDGTVYVGSHDGSLYALDAVTLAPEWERSLGGSIVSSPAVIGGTVYVGSMYALDPSAPDEHRTLQRMHALNATHGTLEWHAPTNTISTSSPAVVDGTVYVGSLHGKLYAVDVGNGLIRWNATIEDGVVGSPAVVYDTVYVGGLDGRVYAVDSADGTLRWNVSTGGRVISTPAVNDGTVYVGSEDGFLYAFDAENGSTAWRYETGDAVLSSPAVANGTVYVGSNDGNLSAVDADSGRERWSHATNDSVVASPTVANGTVYVGSEDGYVYALDAVTGDERWSFPVGFGVHSSPAVVDGIVYVGNNDGTVYALAEIRES